MTDGRNTEAEPWRGIAATFALELHAIMDAVHDARENARPMSVGGDPETMLYAARIDATYEASRVAVVRLKAMRERLEVAAAADPAMAPAADLLRAGLADVEAKVLRVVALADWRGERLQIVGVDG